MSEFVHFLRSACLPAKIYLALIIVNFFSMLLIKKEKRGDLNMMLTTFIIIILVGLAVTWFGNYLCNEGFEVVTWLFVLLPILSLVRNIRKLM